MNSLVSYAAAVCAAAAAWLIRGALALQSAAPAAPKVGLVPPSWELGLFVIAASCVVYLLRPSPDRMLPLFSTAICLLPWVPGVRSPAVLMWTGPLGVALWCGAIAATILHGHGTVRGWLARFREGVFGDARYGPLLASVFALMVFAVVACGARGAVPSGDEPHYLIITQSLLDDADIRIENNHARRDYQAYYDGTLQPDFWRRGRNGAIYSVHAPGLPALIAPAFLIGGYRGVVVFLVVIAAISAGLLWHLAFAMSGRASAAWFAVAAAAIATPVAFHAFTVFPDGPAGFIMLTGVWALLRLARVSLLIPIGSRRAWLLHGSALALLPWMHARLAALAGAMAVVILLRLSRERDGLARAAVFLAVPVISAAGWFAFFYAIYGTPSPAAPWTRLVTSWSFIPGGLAGILFDQQFGALPYAPVLLLGVVGWIGLLRSHRRLALELAAIAVPYMIVTTRLWIWWAGWSAPARFWTPLFWVGGITAAMTWRHARSRVSRGTALGLLFVSAATTLGLGYAYGGRLAYNVRDGYARWFDWLSAIVDLPRGLPSFFQFVDRQQLFDLQILVVVFIVAVAFVVCRWADPRVPGSGAFALLLIAGYATAAMCVIGVLLRMNQASGLRAANAQLRLLDAARNAQWTGLIYQGPWVRVASADQVVQALRIESPPRLAAERGAPPLVLPGWFPAGTYRVSGRPNGTGDAPWEIRVLRAGPPIRAGALAASGGELDVTVTLPVDTPAFVLRSGSIQSAYLQPAHVATRRERPGVARATNARRYGETVAWFVDENAYADPDGIWIKGGGVQARLLLQPDAGNWVRMLVRNGPVENEAMLITEAGDWSWSAPLKPGEEREVRAPVDPARGAVLLRVASRSAFRPSEKDPGSRDTRLLGVWVSPH